VKLRVDGVTFEYAAGKRVLAGVDLAIDPAETVALIGANGSGKTTLARHLVGLLRPSAGRITIDGTDSRDRTVAQLAARVGLAFQQPDRQIFGRTVYSEVEFGPRHLGRSEDQGRIAVDAALKAVGLSDAAGRHPGDLGDSRRKLLSIASVLAMETPIVVLDEPTVGLDANDTGQIRQIITNLSASARTVMVISHDMRFVAEAVGRVVLLDGGIVRRDTSTTEAFSEAAWPAIREAGLEPPAAAIAGARLGLGSTPTVAALSAAVVARAADGDAASASG
jgi:energy-coupling factor transport system ATP-binding protein